MKVLWHYTPPPPPPFLSQVLDPTLFRVNISETVLPQRWIQIKLRVSVIIVSSLRHEMIRKGSKKPRTNVSHFDSAHCRSSSGSVFRASKLELRIKGVWAQGCLLFTWENWKFRLEIKRFAPFRFGSFRKYQWRIPLFLDQTEARSTEKNFFGDRPPLSKGLDDRPTTLSCSVKLFSWFE